MPVGPSILCAGEAVEIAVERTNIDLAVGNGLRAVEQHGHAVLARDRDEFLDRDDRAQRIGNMREREDLRARSDELFEGCEVDFAGASDRNHFERCPGLLADQLPGHDVGVMLEAGDQDFVARTDFRPHETLCDEVDWLRSCRGRKSLPSCRGR